MNTQVDAGITHYKCPEEHESDPAIALSKLEVYKKGYTEAIGRVRGGKTVKPTAVVINNMEQALEARLMRRTEPVEEWFH